MIANPEYSVSITPLDRDTVRKWLVWGLVAYLFGVATGIGYFTIGGIFALLSDMSSVMMGLTMIPVVLGLAKLFDSEKSGLARNARRVGLAGFTLLALGGFVLSLFYFIQSLPGSIALGAQFAGIFLQGIWLIMVGMLTLQTGALPRKPAWAGIIAGAGYFVVAASSAFGFNPISGLGSAMGVVGYILWTLWTRSALRSQA
jgi:hypothetical protein